MAVGVLEIVIVLALLVVGGVLLMILTRGGKGEG